MQEPYKIKKYRGYQQIYLLANVASIGTWGYYYSSYNVSLELFNSKFLPYLSIAEIILSCAIFLFHLFTKRKPYFLKVYKILFTFLLLVLLGHMIMTIGLWIKSPNIFSDFNNNGTQNILSLSELSILCSVLITFIEIKVQKLLLSIQNFNIEFLRDYLLSSQIDNLEGSENLKVEEKKIRVDSMLPSQMNIIFGSQCTICDEETDMEQKAVQLECLHIFHSECIRKWLDNSKICPNCRKEVESN